MLVEVSEAFELRRSGDRRRAGLGQLFVLDSALVLGAHCRKGRGLEA